MKELNAEYGELLSLKKRLYAEYRQARKEINADLGFMTKRDNDIQRFID